MEGMERDKNIDKQLLRQHYGMNCTEMLKHKQRGIDSEDDWDVDYTVERDGYGRKINLNPMDAFDKKRFKEGRLEFIGVKPRVDTNLQLTKEQQDLENRRRIKETRMASKLKKFTKRKHRKPKSIETKKDDPYGSTGEQDPAQKTALDLIFAE